MTDESMLAKWVRGEVPIDRPYIPVTQRQAGSGDTPRKGPFLPPRLPPVVRGACRALHAAPPPVPDSPPAPAEDAPVREVLAEQASELAAQVEAVDPAALESARAAARARDVDEALTATAEILARPRTLTRRGYGVEPHDLEERAHVAGMRAAGCAGGAARLRPYLTGAHRTDEVRERHEALVALEAEWKARAELERYPSRG